MHEPLASRNNYGVATLQEEVLLQVLATLDVAVAEWHRALAGIVTPAILSLTAFFTLLALSNSALQNFSVVSLMATQGLSLSAANVALTAYLLFSALGVLAGGSLADKTQRHGELSAAGFGAAAIIVLLMATLSLPGPVLVVGDCAKPFLEHYPDAQYWGECQEYPNCTPIWANRPDVGIAHYVRHLQEVQEANR